MNAVTNATVVPMAVGQASGKTRFSEGTNPSTGRVAFDGDMDVRSISLDDFVYDAAHPAPHVIKMDIEGGELGALMGATRLLRDKKPTILLATHGSDMHASCIRLLEGLGYRLRPLEGPRIEESNELVARP